MLTCQRGRWGKERGRGRLEGNMRKGRRGRGTIKEGRKDNKRGGRGKNGRQRGGGRWEGEDVSQKVRKEEGKEERREN